MKYKIRKMKSWQRHHTLSSRDGKSIALCTSVYTNKVSKFTKTMHESLLLVDLCFLKQLFMLTYQGYISIFFM